MKLPCLGLVLLGCAGSAGCFCGPNGSREEPMMPRPPPAPMVGPTRDEVIRRVRAHREGTPLTITLGRIEPKAVVLHQAGRWQLRALVTNEHKLAHIQREQQQRGYYMPEHDWGALEPGPALIDEGSRGAFLAALERIEWTY